MSTRWYVRRVAEMSLGFLFAFGYAYLLAFLGSGLCFPLGFAYLVGLLLVLPLFISWHGCSRGSACLMALLGFWLSLASACLLALHVF